MPLWMIHKILHKNLESSCKPSWRKLTIHRRAAAIDIELFALKKPQQSEYENELITNIFRIFWFDHITYLHILRKGIWSLVVGFMNHPPVLIEASSRKGLLKTFFFTHATFWQLRGPLTRPTLKCLTMPIMNKGLGWKATKWS